MFSLYASIQKFILSLLCCVLENFIQKKYNIATIRFVTPSVNLGVKFQDIENAQDVYVKVKEIHENINKEV